MNRQVGACYSICVAIVIFFAVALRPAKEKPDPVAKRADPAARTALRPTVRPGSPR